MQDFHRIDTCGTDKCHHYSCGFLFVIAIVVVSVAKMDCHCHKAVTPAVVVGLALLYTLDYYLMAAPTPAMCEVVVAMVLE
jgi:hypothetical protein